VKKGALAQQDQVRPLGLQENALGRGTGLLSHLAFYLRFGTPSCTVLQEPRHLEAGIQDEAGITTRLVSAPSGRHELGPADRWGIEDPKPYKHGTMPLRPADTEFHCSRAVLRPIHTNQHAP
jgi:hypothetical protein